MTQNDDNLQNEQLIENEEESIENLKDELAEDKSEASFVEEDELINKMEAEINSLKDQVLRKQAEYQNLQARSERDREETTFFITKKVILKMLPTVDNLERILESTPENERETSVYKGVESTYKSLIKELNSMNVVSYTSLGEDVDPDKHEVMTQAPGEEGKIINEFEKGYTIGDRVLRVAKVVVGMGE